MNHKCLTMRRVFAWNPVPISVCDTNWDRGQIYEGIAKQSKWYAWHASGRWAWLRDVGKWTTFMGDVVYVEIDSNEWRTLCNDGASA